MVVEVKEVFEAHKDITEIGDAFNIFEQYVAHCVKYKFFIRNCLLFSLMMRSWPRTAERFLRAI